jgi:glycosyltransferase involved in cell wall biosynthesis
MRILYVRNINQIAEIYAQELTRRHHFTKVYEPNLTGDFRLPPLKFMSMPERIFDLRHVIGQLSSQHFDILHIHWASYGILGLESRIPFVVECHGSDVRYRLENPLFQAILIPVLRRAAAVLCITPDILPIVQSVRPDAQFLPGPVNTQQFMPAEDISPCVSHPWTIFLFTRLNADKGVDIATQGIARFVQRHPGVRIRLLDWGTLRETYKQQYGDLFEFIPRVAPDKVPHLIRSADIVVGQFALGALGLSELQAMSCAKPVICSFRYKEAYPTPPPLCQADTAEEVEEQLESLFQNREAGTLLGRKAREWVINHHDYQILSDKLEALYCSILGGAEPLASTFQKV